MKALSGERILVNFAKENCGVHQYGLLIAEALGIDHVSVLSIEDINEKIFAIRPDVVVWNWHRATLGSFLSPLDRFPWIDLSICLQHEFDTSVLNSPLFDAVVFPDPTCTFRHPRFFNCGRVLPTWLVNPETTHESCQVRIGSFGFAVGMKGFHRLVDLTRQSFESAIIRIHIPANWKVDPTGARARSLVDQLCQRAGHGISIECSSEFLERREMLEWLKKNTVNVFPYDPVPHPGLSSSADLALASGRPIALTRCGLFRHLYHLPITLESFKLKEIVDTSPQYLTPLFDQWSKEKFRDRWEWIIKYMRDVKSRSIAF